MRLDTTTPVPPPPSAPPPGRRRRRQRRSRRWLREATTALWAIEAVPVPAGAGRGGRWRALGLCHLLPLVIYGLIALLVTYPLVRHFATQVPSDGGDALQNYWNYWWIRQALAEGRNPYWTPLLYAPFGAPLYLHTLNLFNGLISLPVQLAFGLIPAYNSVVLLSFVLAAYFAYLLVAEVSGSRLAGFVGGVVYAFGAYHMTHLLGHMNLLASEWLPAYLLCLLRATGATGRRRTLYALAAVGALLLLMFCDWQYVVFAVLFTVSFALYTAVARWSLAPLLVAAAIGGLWALAASPLLVATIGQIRAGQTAPPTEVQVQQHSADLLAFVTPSRLATLWRPALDRLADQIWEPAPGSGIFLGFLPLLLALVAVWRDPRRARFWALAAFLFALLALGPTLQIAGVDRGLSLPYALLQAVPLLNIARVPDRLSIVVTLCLAILVGLGLVALARRFGGRVGPRSRVALVAALVGLLLLEHLAIPFPLEAVSPPRFYQQLAASPEPGTVLELPYCKQCGITNYRQTVHGRPIIGGYISRRLYYPVRDAPPFRDLAPVGTDITPSVETATVGRRVLAYAGVRWIVIFRHDAGLDQEDLAHFLALYADPTPLYQDEEVIVYRPLPGNDLDRFLAPFKGWYPSEVATDSGARFRWFGASASADVWNFTDVARDYTLRFDTSTYRTPRRLEVRLDGQVLGQWEVTNGRHIEIPVRLASGGHLLEFLTLDPPVRPLDLDPAIRDDRSLSFAVANLVLADR